jgi:hypothetical protein
MACNRAFDGEFRPGLRPHHVRRNRAGTWEGSNGMNVRVESLGDCRGADVYVGFGEASRSV